MQKTTLPILMEDKDTVATEMGEMEICLIWGVMVTQHSQAWMYYVRSVFENDEQYAHTRLSTHSLSLNSQLQHCSRCHAHRSCFVLRHSSTPKKGTSIVGYFWTQSGIWYQTDTDSWHDNGGRSECLGGLNTNDAVSVSVCDVVSPNDAHL